MRILGQLIVVFCFLSCAVKPAKIEYGNDSCHFCKMNIVVKTHASQLVTKKGKAFKYDAIECMLNDLKNWDHDKIALFLVTDYDTPEKLIDASNATFLVSESIQSPMGGNLSAFEVASRGQEASSNEKDKTYNWIGIQGLYRNMQ